MQPLLESDRRLTDRLSAALLIALGVWLAASLYFVNLEFDDGYTTIVNSLHFAGASDFYAWPRGPLLGLMLAPAAFLARLLGVHPLDVRPYHAIIVALHFLYLVLVWKMLAIRFGRQFDTLIAYVAAVPTVLFFSYAPFISHDIIPGALALAMVLLADDYMRVPGRRGWVALVALGALAAGIKQTYALIWVAVLAANVLLAPDDHPALAVRARRLLGLAAAAAASGAITWCIYAAALGSSFPEVAFLSRPALQISALSQYFSVDESAASMFYQGVYYRNLRAYGILAVCLVLPGLYFSISAPQRVQRTLAVVWLLLAAMVCLIAMKEVRYLGFLAPLTAALLVPAIARITRIRRGYYAAIAAILLLDLALAGREAMRISEPYYREQIAEFLRPLPTGPGFAGRLIMPGPLSFVAPDPAFFGDRYHRISHLMAIHIRVLYGWPAASVPLHVDAQRLRADDLTAGDFLVISNQVAVREPPIPADNRSSLDGNFVQLLAEVETLTLERRGEQYVALDSGAAPVERMTLLLPTARGSGGPLIGSAGFPVQEVLRLTGASVAEDRIEYTAARIRSMCGIDGCRSL